MIKPRKQEAIRHDGFIGTNSIPHIHQKQEIIHARG